MFFVGNTSGPNTAAETAALARFGHVGLGWQHSGSSPGSHEGHIEAMEQRSAAELKRINPQVKVLGIRNDQVVSPLWDGARARMLDPFSSHFWLRDQDGNPIVGAWTDSPGRNQTMASGPVIKFFLNWTEPAAGQWR